MLSMTSNQIIVDLSMIISLFSAIATARVTTAIDFGVRATNAVPFYTPFYNVTANGFSGPARGWNSFGVRSMAADFQQAASWSFDSKHIQQQCDAVQTQSGFDYVCSIDSGWSVDCNGDQYGVPTPTPAKFPDGANITDLANYLHNKGMKLGLYVVPGAFTGDAGKTVKGTSIQIGSLFDTTGPTPNCRGTFDYTKDGVQQWHDSVVATFLSWGVDMLKVDYITPGSPDNNVNLPFDNSGTVKMYHQAIINNNAVGRLRLDISWKLNQSEPWWGIWQSSADSLRTDTDINLASGSEQFTSWANVLRTIETYRQFINAQTTPDRQGKAVMIRPDMDNTYIGNSQAISGLSDVQRYSMAIHWVGSGANTITGSDMTRVDTLGTLLLNDLAVWGQGGVASFTQQYPMQPRNPSSSVSPGSNNQEQLQAWIAGPDPSNKAVVILSNYGTDGDVQLVSINYTDLGLGSISNSWNVDRVWGGGGSGGQDHSQYGPVQDKIESNLGPGESVMYVLTKA